jgi:hypothetical protein
MHESARQNPDGTWSPATPLPWMGRTARVEVWLRRHGRTRLANLAARWDERRLGR